MSRNSNLNSLLFKLSRRFERGFAILQGKGYGSATIQKEVELVQSFLKSPPLLAIDIGGNVGKYTAELRLRNPHLEIHTFEPSDTNYQKLTKRFRDDPKVFLQPFAASDSEGNATLFSNEPGSGLGSLTQRKLDHFNIPFDTTEAVKIIRFDSYWENTLLKRHIDILKMDIEGHELNALRGCGEALKHTSVIQFEFGGCNIDTRTFFQDFWYFFVEKNYAIYRITPFGAEFINSYKESDEFFSTTNYIAVNKDVKPTPPQP
jgi:FkbM family methyltransferase